MRFQAWEPVYQEILDDFGFTRHRDEEGAVLLSRLLCSCSVQEDVLNELSEILRDESVVVCGNAPSLAKELADLTSVSCKGPEKYVFIAADGATTTLLSAGIIPEVIVTDLDGNVEDILKANRSGSLVVVHAHGDNLDALERYVPRFGRALGTCQCRPPEGLFNFGGFTDGDRCVFLARHFGAGCIRLVGFDFSDKSVTPRKSKKLAWARRLIRMAMDEK